jgi:hypothetical protein
MQFKMQKASQGLKEAVQPSKYAEGPSITEQGQARNPKAKCRQTHKTQCSCLQTRSVSEITSRVMLIHSN